MENNSILGELQLVDIDIQQIVKILKSNDPKDVVLGLEILKNQNLATIKSIRELLLTGGTEHWMLSSDNIRVMRYNDGIIPADTNPVYI